MQMTDAYRASLSSEMMQVLMCEGDWCWKLYCKKKKKEDKHKFIFVRN